MKWTLEGKRRDGEKRGLKPLSAEDARRTFAEEQAIDRVKRKFEAMQLEMPTRPLQKDGSLLDPELPFDLTTLNDTQIGRLFTQFCRMAQFCQLQLAVKSVAKSVAKQAEKYVRAETRLRKEGTVSRRADLTEVDGRVRDRTIKTLTSEGVEALTDAMLQRYLIGRDAISREMTRRSWQRDPTPSR